MVVCPVRPHAIGRRTAYRFAALSLVIAARRHGAERRVLSAGDVQSSLRPPTRRDRRPIGDVRSHARRSVHRRRQPHRAPARHARLPRGRARLRRSTLLRQAALRRRRARPPAARRQAVLQPTHHVPRGVLLVPLRSAVMCRDCRPTVISLLCSRLAEREH